MKELEYPFDSSFLLQKRRKLKKALLADGSARMEKRIAVLGGSTTNDIVSMLELFLLNCGIQPVFYQSEYAQYWQDAMFDAPELAAFQPDLIFIHTTSRNITEAPLPLSASEQEVQDALERQYTHFTQMWEHLAATYHCPILQNNFELPATRLMGNRDGWDCHGMVWFISELNRKFGQYAAAHNDFYIHDIHYLAASYGLDAWHDNSYWYLYKYAMTLDAVPEFAYSLTRIIRSIYGKNKKSWRWIWTTRSGAVSSAMTERGHCHRTGDCRGRGIHRGAGYCKAQKQLGVLLTVCSKMSRERQAGAVPSGLCCMRRILSPSVPTGSRKTRTCCTAETLSLLPESFVFVDDNPAERDIVSAQIPALPFRHLTAQTASVSWIMPAILKRRLFGGGCQPQRDVPCQRKACADAADLHDYLLGLDMRRDPDFDPVALPVSSS
ncbi:MAG: HAD family hydrolase [Ruminococcus callidus]